MPTGITKNTFDKLRNTDISQSSIMPNQYVAAHNVQASGEGSYFSLRNIKGTTEVQTIIASVADGVDVPGLTKARFLINDVLTQCVVIFTADEDNLLLKIWCYDTENDDLYELFEETVESDYFTNDRVIDSVVFPENSTDIIYFTDNYSEMRQLRCVIPNSYSANFLNSYDLSLLRGGANGTITLDGVSSGGTLLSGTYQFSYRMVDPVNKKFTKWSTLTSPVHVYDAENGSSPVHAGIGLPTARKISIDIEPAFDELDNFEYVQIAVVENTTATAPIKASLLEITSIPTPPLSFEYKSNVSIGSIPLTDITIDSAQIDHVKTLNIKDNRMFAGNVQYTELLFDNGDPEITSGSIRVRSSSAIFGSNNADSYSDDAFSSTYVGYWRDEVYRFGIVYSDGKGNKSPVKPLDLNGITGNQISGSLTDVKFPSRATSNSYTTLSASNRTRGLGLDLVGITNHPTWARSFEIVRVKRKKNILFQTPMIPMSIVSGVGAASNYPSHYYNGVDGVDVTDAQPQTAGEVLVPKNLFWPELRHIVQNGQPIATVIPGPFGTLTNPAIFRSATEVKLKRESDYSFASIFPAPNMYGDTVFDHTGAEKIDIIDYALLRVDFEDFKDSSVIPSSYNTGAYVDTSVVGNFYAIAEGQYYFDATWTGKSISSTYKNIPLTDYEYFSGPDAQPASVGGMTTLDYEALQTKGIGFWQYQPTIQRMAVVQLGREQSERALAFKAGNLNAVSSNGFVVGSSGIRYETSTTLRNNYVDKYSSFTNRSSYISAIPIVNVKLGLGDDRYGDINAFHEYISTGAKYTFSESEVTTLQSGGSVSVDIEVWGGDCFVGAQLFKVCDSTYSLTNQSKNNSPSSPDSASDQVGKWDSIYRYETSGTNPVMCIPVAMKNSGQYVQVILESEYNGEVRDNDTIEESFSTLGYPVYLNQTEASIRTPLTYKYNINLSKQNDQKIFVPKPQYNFEQNYFGARIVFSDLKIYNSDLVGFDTFRVGNFYDLEEKNYNITKLALSGADLIAIQEKGIVYLPTGQQQVELSDAGTLGVGSDVVIGRPIVINSERGSQHLRSVIETGTTVFIADNRNQAVYALSDKQLSTISDIGNQTAFREMFTGTIPEKNLFGVYDPLRKEYWIVDNTNFKCHVFNEEYGGWVGEYDFSANKKLYGGILTNQKLYLVGKNANLVIAEAYTGTVNQLFGETVVPSVTVVINPDEPIAKTFDNIMIVATERLSTLDLEVKRETELGNQTCTGIDLDSTSIEGNFRVKVLRDSLGARLRGQRMLATVKWKEIQSAVNSINTKYRPSSRTPW